MKFILKTCITVLFLLFFQLNFAQSGYLHADGKAIVDGSGNNYLLRGIGTGNWMLMEGYMMKTSGVAGTQHEFREKLVKTIGEEKTEEFFDTWLANHFTKTDVDSMKAWGFNSVRVALHYKWFTLPIEEEPIPGQNTWLNKGFEMIDDLLEWCSANEMYLLLDMHGAPGGQGKNADISDYDPSKPSLWESQDNQDKLTALWFELAKRYKDEPWIGGYDLINETNWDFENNPDDNSGWSNTKNTPLLNMHKRLIDTIRTVDNNHLVFVSGNSWGNNYNGMNSLASYDDNLAYTFHKYWNTNNENDLDWITSKRDELNVPLWMSESGENSNTWFTDAISLFERNNIGWSWWPVKKEGRNNVLYVHLNKEYNDLIKYWKGEISKAPSEADAFQAVMQWSENHKIENCEVQYGVIDAMFRQVQGDKSPLPFKEHNLPGTIYATDYDYGANQYAYYDADVARTSDETVGNKGYAYRNDGVDIEACNDAFSNGYNVGWTEDAEWMIYTVQIDSTASYTLNFRYAANSSGSKFHFELNDVAITNSISLPATGGWTSWSTYSTEGILLQKGVHQLKLHVDKAGFNVASFSFTEPRPINTITADFLKFETDSSGENICITSNLGFDQTIAPALTDFELKISDKEIAIESIEYDTLNSTVLRLKLDSELIQTDRVYITYAGSSLVSPDGQTYPTFSNKLVENNSPYFIVLPGRFQAEDFVKNEGFELEDCTDTGGGYNLSYASRDDYTEYDAYLSQAGQYVFTYRLASGNSGRFKMQLITGDEVTDLHSVTASTGGWQNWQSKTVEATLPDGKFKLRLLAVSGEFNLNWIEVGFKTKKYRLPMNASSIKFTTLNNQLILVNPSGITHNCSIEIYRSNGHKLATQSMKLNGSLNQEVAVFLPSKELLVVRMVNNDQIITQRIIVP